MQGIDPVAVREDANLGRWPLDLANAPSLRSVTIQSAVRLGPEAPLQASPVTIQSAVRLGPEAPLRASPVTIQSAVRLEPVASLEASPMTRQSAVRLGPEASESHPYAGAIQRVLALEGLDVLSWRNHMGSRAVL